MAVTLIDVVDTTVKIGFGVIVGGSFTLLVEHLKRREERRREFEELRRRHFVDPSGWPLVA